MLCQLYLGAGDVVSLVLGRCRGCCCTCTWVQGMLVYLYLGGEGDVVVLVLGGARDIGVLVLGRCRGY